MNENYESSSKMHPFQKYFPWKSFHLCAHMPSSHEYIFRKLEVGNAVFMLLWCVHSSFCFSLFASSFYTIGMCSSYLHGTFSLWITSRGTRMYVCESCSFIIPYSQAVIVIFEIKGEHTREKNECVSEKWLNVILMCHRHRQKPNHVSVAMCDVYNNSFVRIRSLNNLTAVK